MTNQRRRLLELALESLRKKKSELDVEIETVMREMRGPARAHAAAAVKRSNAPARKRPRLSRTERLKRSARMKAYWERRRKEKRTET